MNNDKLINEVNKISGITEQLDSKVSKNKYFVDIKNFNDGKLDDKALIDAYNYALTNGGILYLSNKDTLNLTTTIELYELTDIKFMGKIKLTNCNLTISHNCRIGVPTNYYVNEIWGGELILSGLTRGSITVNYCETLKLFADGSTQNKYSLAYSDLTLGYIKNLILFSVNDSYKKPWINENKFYGGRIENILFDGANHYNNNIFYGTMLEGCNININTGRCNYFYDCRFENLLSLTFGKDTNENVFVRSWTGTNFIFLGGHNAKFTNNGKNNGVYSSMDAYFNKTKIFSLNNYSKNYMLERIKRNENSLSIVGNSKEIFNTDFIKIDNPFGFRFLSDKSLFRMFLYVFDENKQPITTEPLNFTNIYGATWNNTGYYSFATGQGDKLNNGGCGIPIYSDTNVKYIKLRITTVSYEDNAEFNYFDLYKIENKGDDTIVRVLDKYTKLTHYEMPTDINGVYEIGTIVYSSIPATTRCLGWLKASSTVWKEIGTFA